MLRVSEFPAGASVTLQQLDDDPHPVLARLREHEPVSWVPALGGWLVTSYAHAQQVMRDPVTFTVDDPRFSTAQVIGPSMLSLDGEAHEFNRAPFVAPFRPTAVRERFTALVERHVERLIDGLERDEGGELRRGFAGPLAAAVVAEAIGLEGAQASAALEAYDSIVAAVTAITAGEEVGEDAAGAFAGLCLLIGRAIECGDAHSVLGAAASGSPLAREQILSNASVLLFGGIETTEGMIANALLALLARPQQLSAACEDPQLLEAAIEESLRLEPAAAVVDRYAAVKTKLASATISARDLVRVSIAAANRDPEVFSRPDEWDLARSRGHLAFAQGPHVCLGIHLARLEARIAISALLHRLPALRLDSSRPSTVSGLVFRKPRAVWALW